MSLELESGMHHVQVSNKTYRHLEEVHGVKGGLSKQFPTIANPAPLGLAGFALTTFVLSMMNAGVIVGEPDTTLTLTLSHPS